MSTPPPWKLAFSTLACPGWTLVRALQEARRWGYDGLELRLIDGRLIEPDLDASERERIARLLARSGLHVVAADSSIRLIGEPQAVKVETDLCRFLELAAAWSAPLVRVFGGGPPDTLPEPAALARAVRILERAAAVAGRLGVKIGLETHDAFSSAATVAKVLDRVPSPQVGVIWDLLHTHRMGETPSRVWSLVGPRILGVHVKDALRAPVGGWRLVLLGDGEVPVRESLHVLRQGGYRGWLVAEWEKLWHPEIDEPEAALPHEIAVLRKWLDALQ